MARLSSRELALERRKALTTSGKKAAVASGSGRVRIAADARSTRTLANASDAVVEVSTPAVASSATHAVINGIVSPAFPCQAGAPTQS